MARPIPDSAAGVARRPPPAQNRRRRRRRQPRRIARATLRLRIGLRKKRTSSAHGRLRSDAALALETGDDALERQAESLQQKAEAAYKERTANIAAESIVAQTEDKPRGAKR